MKITTITSNKYIPIKTVLNRTPVFEPTQKKERSIKNTRNKSHEKNSIIFEDDSHKLDLVGCSLNHSIDYPLLALVIKHWLNNQLAGIDEPDVVTIQLEEIKQVFKLEHKQSCSKNYKPYRDSLIRLHSAVFILKMKQTKDEHIGNFFSQPSNFSYKEKKITVHVGAFLKSLYKDHNGISLIDIDEIVNTKSEPLKAMKKYLMTHSISFIDFKFERLSKVLGYHTRDIDDAKRREYIIKALRDLCKDGYLQIAEYFPAKNTYRIIQSRFFDPVEAHWAFYFYPSNFDKIKRNKLKKTMAKNMLKEIMAKDKDEFPF